MELLDLPKITDVEIKELQEFETQSTSVMDEAKMVVRTIHDLATKNAADQWVAAKLGWCDRIENGWLGLQANRLFKLHREWTGKINELILPVKGDKKKGIKGAVDLVIEASMAWQRAEDKRIADENAKAMEAARKKDEEERLAAAQKLEAAGNKTMADAVLNQAGNFVAPVIQAPKSEFTRTRKIWRARFDPSKKAELLQMIAGRPDLHAFVEIDWKKVERHIANLDGNLVPAWPGVTPYQEEAASYRHL